MNLDNSSVNVAHCFPKPISLHPFSLNYQLIMITSPDSNWWYDIHHIQIELEFPVTIVFGMVLIEASQYRCQNNIIGQVGQIRRYCTKGFEISISVSEMDHSRNSNFILVISSHGESGQAEDHNTMNRDFITAVNGGRVFYDKITSYFTETACPSLKDKPKLFFIQVLFRRWTNVFCAHDHIIQYGYWILQRHVYLGPPSLTWCNLIPTLIKNHIHYKVWDESIYPFHWDWISNLIPHFAGHVITYPCWD